MPTGSRSLDSLRFAARVAVLAHYLGLLLGPLGVLTCVPAAVAWASGRPDMALYNLAVAGGLIGLGAFGWKAGRRADLHRPCVYAPRSQTPAGLPHQASTV